MTANGKMQWVYNLGDPLPEPAARMKSLLGGKGASLAAMSQAGLNVPPAFTITTECCRYYFENGETWPEGLADEIRRHLRRLEETTGRSFGTGKRPLFVSVRSGAEVSMPGMMDTILNCGIHPALADELGDTPRFWNVYIQFVQVFARIVARIDPQVFASRGASATGDESPSRTVAKRYLHIYRETTGKPFPATPWDLLVACINAVFRSWRSERAMAYRERNDIRGLPGTAVTVQAMFPSQISGILFTEDPNDLSAEQMVIESSYGLGEAVVSGDVTPDRFFVKRGDFGAIRSSLGAKSHVVCALGEERRYDPDAPSLSPEQIAELCELAMRVESLYEMPMDIEWGWADGRFALLQCRPIRGLEVARDVEAGRQAEIARLRERAAGTRGLWVAHNLGETLRFPTPLTWDITRRLMSGSGGFGRMYQDLGYRPSREVCENGFLELICGRVYADPERSAQLFWDRMPMTYDRDAILKDKRVLDRAPSQFDPEKVDARFLLGLPGLIRSMMRSAKIMKRARKTAREVFEHEVLPAYREYVREKRDQDLSARSSSELTAELHDRCTRVLDDFGKESLKPGFFGALAFDEVEGMLIQLLGEEAGAQLTNTLTMGLEGDLTFEQDAMLHRVARGDVSMDAFVDAFGHRAVGEMELAEPRWREDPTYLRQIVESLRSSTGRSPLEIHEENVKKRQAAQDDLAWILEQWGGSSFREQIEGSLRDAQVLLPYRETGKHYLMMGYELIRLVIVELSRRWDLGRDVFFLHLEELSRFEAERSRLAEEIGRRKTRWQAFQRLDVAEVIDSADLEGLGLAPDVERAADLRGEPVAAGVATGTARIVFDPRTAGDLGTDYILVCPSTDPGWTPLFINARGLVVERGGVLSHGAIVARDFGIPAVVCPDATRLLPGGAAIRIDGNRGTISVLDEAT